MKGRLLINDIPLRIRYPLILVQQTNITFSRNIFSKTWNQAGILNAVCQSTRAFSSNCLHSSSCAHLFLYSNMRFEQEIKFLLETRVPPPSPLAPIDRCNSTAFPFLCANLVCVYLQKSQRRAANLTLQLPILSDDCWRFLLWLRISCGLSLPEHFFLFYLFIFFQNHVVD